MAEAGGIQPEKDSLKQDTLSLYIASFELKMAKNHPVIAQALDIANKFRTMQFDSIRETLEAVQGVVSQLDHMANSNKLLGKKVTLEADEIWIHEPHPSPDDPEDIRLQKRLLREEESISAGIVATHGTFYGFVSRAIESEDDFSKYRPTLSFQVLRSTMDSTFSGIRFYAVGEVCESTKLIFETDNILAETKTALMTLSGKDENGKDCAGELVDRSDLIELVALFNANFSETYNVEIFTKIDKIIRNMKIQDKTDETKNDAQRGLEKLILLGLNLSPRRIFNLSCSQVIDKQISSFDDSKSVKVNMKTVSGDAKVTGPVLGIDFMPLLDENEGLIKALPELFPHFVIEEQFDDKGVEIAEKDRRLRYVPLRSISDFTLLKG